MPTHEKPLTGAKRTVRRALVIILVLLGVTVAYLLLWPGPIEPVRYIPSKNPGTTGPFVENEILIGVQHLIKGIGQGPEDIAKEPDEWFYTGLQDGRIVRFKTDDESVETFVSTGGRPLGMQFDAEGNLIVADAFEGLLCRGRHFRRT
jgi:hypothetical protein